jgi:hypothetical protein
VVALTCFLAGGVAGTLLGLIAAAHGPRGALLALLALTPLALLCGTLLRHEAG